MGKSMKKLLKPIKACVAIILTIPAVFLPFRLQKTYKHAMSLIAYKLKDYKFISNLVTIQKQEHNRETHNGNGK